MRLNNQTVIGLLLFLVCASTTAALAQGVRQRRPWNDLNYYLGREMSLSLPDGTDLRGRLMAVRQNDLELNVSETSNRRLYPKGKTMLPRESVFAVSIFERRERGSPSIEPGYAIVGVLGGAYLGMGIGGRIGGEKGMERGVLIGMVTGGVLVTLAGMRRRYETVTTVIEILPERASQGQTTRKLPGDEMLRRAPRPEPAPDTWAVTPSRSRADWAF